MLNLIKDPADIAIGRARRLGAEHGNCAAGWVFDGNTPGWTYEKFLKWDEDGDPELWNYLPSDGLSGEWADGYSARDLERDLGLTDTDGELLDEACSAYTQAHSDACRNEVMRVAREMTAPE